MRLGRGEVYAALAAMCFGSAYVATSFALRSFQPLPAAVYRSLLAAVALALLLGYDRRGAVVTGAAAGVPVARRRALHLLVLGILGGAVFLTGMNLAVAGVGPTIASFVAGLYAVLAAVFAPFVLREPLRARTLAAFVVALAGTGLLAQLEVGGTDPTGIGWGLVAAVSFALFLVLSRRWGRSDGLGGIQIALAAMGVASVALGALVVATDPGALVPRTLVPEAIVAMAWLVLTAAAGQALGAASMRLIPASRSAAFLLLNPITATVLAFLLLGVRPSPLQLVGALLVLLGIAAATFPGRGASSDRTTPAPVR